MTEKDTVESTQSQDFGEAPLNVRETDHYHEEYVHDFVQKWDELIDWDARFKTEGDFFINMLKKRGAKNILDVATGTGYHSVRLIEAGFNVVSVDGSAEMLFKAFENAKKRGHVLRTVQADWRILNRDVHEEFDAVVCLGNSFTHLFDDNDRRKALAEFYAVLRHDGILILDQRNYDTILDNGFSSKHTYYYCGDNVSARPEHIDEGLARFQYSFPDGSNYHLNMFPLRKTYMQRLLREVGFQTIETFGDFQETYHEEEPDFYVHVSDKTYLEKHMDSNATQTAREYYNSDDAEEFYSKIWGGEDIHIGLYEQEDEPIFDASRRTVRRLSEHAGKISETTRVLDIGSGYCGAARYLAKEHGCKVVALNLSEIENTRARSLNTLQGLEAKIDVIDGSFEKLPFSDNTFELVWCQDAILHSGKRGSVISEVSRVLAPGGCFVFTDPMQSNSCPKGVLQPVLDRIHLQNLGSPAFYHKLAKQCGLAAEEYLDFTPELITHYTRVLQETTRRTEELSKTVTRAYVERMKEGLEHWIVAGNKGYLAWGMFRFRKPKR